MTDILPMKSDPIASDVTVIIVTYNSAHCIKELAPALKRLPHVAVVDNASDDNTVATVAIELPNAKVFRNARNLGFGAANNVALSQCNTRYALLLNPDCLPEHDFVERLLEVAASYPDASIIAPHLLRKGNRVELSYRWPATYWTSRGPAAEGACCVGFVCGAVMLLKMDTIRETGFFDQDFFLYYEDEDLCQRLFNRKESIILAPSVTVRHLSRGSVRGPNPLTSEFLRGFHHAQSKLIFAYKHDSRKSIEYLRWRVLGLAITTLIPRLLVPMPRYLARLTGRIYGLIRFKHRTVH